MKFFKDMDDNQFYMTTWTFVITGVLILAMIIGYFTDKEDRMIRAMIESGHSPLEIACVYKSSDRNEARCLLLAQGQAARK